MILVHTGVQITFELKLLILTIFPFQLDQWDKKILVYLAEAGPVTGA